MTNMRLGFVGDYFHIYNRTNHHETERLYKSNADYQRFTDIMIEEAIKYNVTIVAWTLMPNHYHIYVRLGRESLSEFMRDIGSRYVKYFNLTHDLKGHMFEKRFDSKIVQTDINECNLARYIHLNTVNVKNIKHCPFEHKIKLLNDFQWSSLDYYIHPEKGLKEVWFDNSGVLEHYGDTLKKQSYKYERMIKRAAYKSAQEVSNAIFDKTKIKGNAIIGDEEFANLYRAKIELRQGQGHIANRIVGQEVSKFVTRISVALDINQAQLFKKGLRQHVIRDIIIHQSIRFLLGKETMTSIGKYFGELTVSSISKIEKTMNRRLENDEALKKVVMLMESCLFDHEYECLKEIDFSEIIAA